ncbi:MAG: SWIM zinc finger family protein [Nitrosospira sp.]|nr:SWIM zinc finger family protein [Nitrosospira sp.]
MLFCITAFLLKVSPGGFAYGRSPGMASSCAAESFANLAYSPISCACESADLCLHALAVFP